MEGEARHIVATSSLLPESGGGLLQPPPEAERPPGSHQAAAQPVGAVERGGARPRWAAYGQLQVTTSRGRRIASPQHE